MLESTLDTPRSQTEALPSRGSFFVIGLDPPTGLCVIDGTGKLVLAREIPGDDADLIAVIDGVLGLVTNGALVFGVELPADVLIGGRGTLNPGARISIERALNKARGRADKVAILVKDRRPDVVVFEGRAAEIRKAVFGKIPKELLPEKKKRDRAAEIDRFIARMLPPRIQGWPKRSNSHERDAGAVALWAAQRYRIERLGLSLPAPQKRARRAS